MVICLERGANDLHMVQLMPLPPHHLLLQQNPEWLSFWYQPTQVDLEKKAVKRLCVYVLVRKMSFPGYCISRGINLINNLPFLP